MSDAPSLTADQRAEYATLHAAAISRDDLRRLVATAIREAERAAVRATKERCAQSLESGFDRLSYSEGGRCESCSHAAAATVRALPDEVTQ